MHIQILLSYLLVVLIQVKPKWIICKEKLTYRTWCYYYCSCMSKCIKYHTSVYGRLPNKNTQYIYSYRYTFWQNFNIQQFTNSLYFWDSYNLINNKNLVNPIDQRIIESPKKRLFVNSWMLTFCQKVYLEYGWLPNKNTRWVVLAAGLSRGNSKLAKKEGLLFKNSPYLAYTHTTANI